MYTKIPASLLCSVELSTNQPVSSATKVLERHSSQRTSGSRILNKSPGYSRIAMAKLMHWGFADQHISRLFTD